MPFKLPVDAIERAATIDRSKIRAALAQIRGFEGVTGTISFHNHGDPVNKGASILRFRDGRWVFYKAFEPQ